jgi:hypothetical protein
LNVAFFVELFHCTWNMKKVSAIGSRMPSTTRWRRRSISGCFYHLVMSRCEMELQQLQFTLQEIQNVMKWDGKIECTPTLHTGEGRQPHTLAGQSALSIHSMVPLAWKITITNSRLCWLSLCVTSFSAGIMSVCVCVCVCHPSPHPIITSQKKLHFYAICYRHYAIKVHQYC